MVETGTIPGVDSDEEELAAAGSGVREAPADPEGSADREVWAVPVG
jgi:hypothetical protein